MIDFKLDIDIESNLLEGFDKSFEDVFNIQNFSVELNENPKNDIDEVFMENFNLNKNFSINLSENEIKDIDSIFKEEFAPNLGMSFNIDLNPIKNSNDSDFRNHFKLLQNFSINLSENEIKDIDSIFKEEFYQPIPELTVLENDIILPEIKKQNDIFDICLDSMGNVDDLIFEDYFKEDVNYDYGIINKLKKDLNSRKILTREEREQIPENESIISSIELDKKETLSIEEDLRKSESVIKENSFYKIVEIDQSELKNTPTKVETSVDTSYREEVDQKIIDLESKYEDLLQKTKDGYEDKLSKIVDDFSSFRNHITQQVTRMSFIASSSAGGGAVNILDMDDVNKTNLQNGYVLSYNNFSKKFEFINPANIGSSASFDSMQADVFTITQNDLDNSYIDLSAPADSNYYELSEFHINGIVNVHQTNYTFLSSNRVDISNLILDVGDIIRIVYIKT
ncbi:MAG: hypothetical protein CMP21_03810 [Rickettsiales bacterium]|nr:hypothetical protein [Rickettsiales bacterium]|tara:strand:- start:394 stop:1752 length:1359 start_codon:yes stop_codon:yes gene_type:complete